jgi:hypothetical protein
MAKIKYHSRKFLNKNQGIAAIETNVESYTLSSGIDATVTISDCSRQVSLDFSIYDKKDVSVKIDKLSLLINELTKLRDVIITNEYEIYEAFEVAAKKRKEDKKKEVVPVEL